MEWTTTCRQAMATTITAASSVTAAALDRAGPLRAARAVGASIGIDESFAGSTLDDSTSWITLASETLIEWPCLTASTGTLDVAISLLDTVQILRGAA